MKASQFIKLIILLFYTIACANKNPGETANDNNVKDTALATNAVVTDTFEAGKVIAHVFAKLMLLNLMLYTFLQKAIKKHCPLFIFLIRMVMVHFH